MAKEEDDAGVKLFKELLYADELHRTEFLEIWHEEYNKIARSELAERRKESLDNLEEQDLVDLVSELSEQEQEDFSTITIIKLGRRIAELKEQQKRELHFQQGAEEEQDEGTMNKGLIIKFIWLFIFTAGIIYVFVAMIAGWLRIIHGIIILFILFGCVAAMYGSRNA